MSRPIFSTCIPVNRRDIACDNHIAPMPRSKIQPQRHRSVDLDALSKVVDQSQPTQATCVIERGTLREQASGPFVIARLLCCVALDEEQSSVCDAHAIFRPAQITRPMQSISSSPQSGKSLYAGLSDWTVTRRPTGWIASRLTNSVPSTRST